MHMVWHEHVGPERNVEFCTRVIDGVGQPLASAFGLKKGVDAKAGEHRARRGSPDPAARPTAGLPSLAGRLGLPTPPPRSPQERAQYLVILRLSTRRPAARPRKSPMLRVCAT